jgi:hypothetical protein
MCNANNPRHGVLNLRPVEGARMGITDRVRRVWDSGVPYKWLGGRRRE